MGDGKIAGADISDCNQYRYRLWRRWGSGPRALWIMLNPSTADALIDDPTIRRCAGFTRAWGCGGFDVVNLFAVRATDPRELAHHPEPTGSMNLNVLQGVLKYGAWRHRVAAWGTASVLSRSALRFKEKWLIRLAPAGNLECLGVTKAGHPRHPLYLPKSAKLQPWPANKDPNA